MATRTKVKMKICRKCGRIHATKPGQPHASKCRCGGKLIVNVEESVRNTTSKLEAEKQAIKRKIEELDAQDIQKNSPNQEISRDARD